MYKVEIMVRMLKSKELEEKIDNLIYNNDPSSTQGFPVSPNKSRSLMKWAVLALVAVAVGCAALIFYPLRRVQIKQKRMERVMQKMQNGILNTACCLGKKPMPFKFTNIPFADEQGIITNVKTVTLRDVYAPYNPSILRTETGYDLFFRYDVISSRSLNGPFFSRIGVASLDHNFEQDRTESRTLRLPTDYAEDPRTIIVDDQLFLFYNALNLDNLKCRSMCLSRLDPSTYEVMQNDILEMNLQWMEKNWAPFVYADPLGKSRLLAEYQLTPRKVIEIPQVVGEEIAHVILPRDVAYFDPLWGRSWGEMRGGTPSLKIGDEYLGFFHSSFKCNDNVWYVMGAYTFEAAPPFRLTSISPYPILFRGIYELPYANVADSNKCVIFPSGFVIEPRPEGDLIHLACGENDSGIKIVTFNKEMLLHSLHRLKH